MPHATSTTRGRICPPQKPICQPLPSRRGPGPGTPLLLSTLHLPDSREPSTHHMWRWGEDDSRQAGPAWLDQQTLALSIQAGMPARTEKPDRTQLKRLCRRSRCRPYRFALTLKSRFVTSSATCRSNLGTTAARLAGLAARRNCCRGKSSGGACDIPGDDAGRVPVQAAAGPVIAHRRPRVSMGGCLLDVARRHPGIRTAPRL
jgi:hypothetical protein